MEGKLLTCEGEELTTRRPILDMVQRGRGDLEGENKDLARALSSNSETSEIKDCCLAFGVS
eukprot:13495139-Alexandrium_andersonii.AAC.1